MLPISIISLLAFYVCALEPPFPQAVVQGMAQLSYLPSLINTSQSFTEISPAELAAFLTSASTDTTDPKSEHVPEHDNRNDQWTFRRLRLSRVTSRTPYIFQTLAPLALGFVECSIVFSYRRIFCVGMGISDPFVRSDD
ncbi:hypothetical protein HO133_001317 [Letharia lupina]|uniref:Uncharacterized protein n=1 Tax=Letharia lupina TaxID=560253 RepID=A0A8H6FBP0_9LECA|nr:uncharacterized protein HO133_001317 [Letharia lupina]KAF6222231.1 hypothetical protein HO133_001317 [Letharia lupina]